MSAARDPRPPRPPRDEGREMVWFRLNIGRDRNADPRWLLPLICRAGGVSKAEIGAIKIFDRDTRFQVVAEFADQFAHSVRTNGSKEGQISRLGAHASAAASETKAEPAEPGDGAAQATADSPHRDRGKPKPGPRPHRKGTGYQPRPQSPAARHPGSGGPKPAHKYAHKKKNRSGQPAKV